MLWECFFFFNDTATTEIYTLSLHDALPICPSPRGPRSRCSCCRSSPCLRSCRDRPGRESRRHCLRSRSEEHTSELQSRQYLVCRLLLEKKNRRSFYNASLPSTAQVYLHIQA